MWSRTIVKKRLSGEPSSSIGLSTQRGEKKVVLWSLNSIAMAVAYNSLVA